MTTSKFTVVTTPNESGPVGDITLKLDERVLDASLYDDWMLAAKSLHGLTPPAIPDGNFAAWYLWSLQCDRDPISLHSARGVWEGLGPGDAQSLSDLPWPTPATHPNKRVNLPDVKPIEQWHNQPADPRQPVLAKTTRNAVALILDKHTDLRCGQLYVTDVAELQRELVELVDAAATGAQVTDKPAKVDPFIDDTIDLDDGKTFTHSTRIPKE